MGRKEVGCGRTRSGRGIPCQSMRGGRWKVSDKKFVEKVFNLDEVFLNSIWTGTESSSRFRVLREGLGERDRPRKSASTYVPTMHRDEVLAASFQAISQHLTILSTRCIEEAGRSASKYL